MGAFSSWLWCRPFGLVLAQAGVVPGTVHRWWAPHVSRPTAPALLRGEAHSQMHMPVLAGLCLPGLAGAGQSQWPLWPVGGITYDK